MITLFFREGPVRSWDDAVTSDTKRFGTWHAGMLARGIYWPPSQFEAAFLCGAHTEADIERAVKASREALRVGFADGACLTSSPVRAYGSSPGRRCDSALGACSSLIGYFCFACSTIAWNSGSSLNWAKPASRAIFSGLGSLRFTASRSWPRAFGLSPFFAATRARP